MAEFPRDPEDDAIGRAPDHHRAAEDEDRQLLLDARREISRSTRLASVFLLVLMAVAVAMAWWSREGDDVATNGGAEEAVVRSAPEDPDQTDQGSAEAGAGARDDDGDGDGDDATPASDEEAEATAGTTAALPEPPADGPFVDAKLADEVFVLSGVVPSSEIKELLEAKAEVAYAPFNSSELLVDESVGSADWLASAPEVVGLLPMITDGTIRIQDDSVTLVGRSPNPEYAAGFQQAVGQLTGLPVSADGIEITNLVPPRFVATLEDGTLALEGEIPSAELIETFILGAASIYGPDNVTSTMTVDQGTYTSFWNYTMPGVFQLLAPFPAYRIQVENGVTSGALRGGVVFELNSAEISEEATTALATAVAVLSRDRSISMVIVGHTDNSGPDEVNRRLSLARAQSAVDFLVGAGIDPARLAAEGRGSDEPIVSNDTAEGRTINRRIEFVLQ